MAWFSIFSLRSSSSRNDQIAEEIAGSCYNAVQQRLSHDCFAMNPSEARGYVRARATAVVHRELQRYLSRHPQVRKSQAGPILTLAMEEVVRSTLLRLRRSVPMPSLRQAA